ncbi:Hsp20/alpha crystallin family protein [Segatella copri]
MNATAPAVNVKESATAYTMEVAAPGLKKDMVKMNIDKDGYLNVSIENKDEKKEEHYLRREFSYSSYSQSYALPEDADQEKISAEVSDGVLKIEIPKTGKEEKKDDVKHIEVK